MTTPTPEPARSRRPGRIGSSLLAAALTATAVLAVPAPADATTLGTVVEVSGRDGLTEATAYAWAVAFDCDDLTDGPRQVQTLLAEPVIDRWYQITLTRTNDASCNTYGGGEMPTVSQNGDLVVVVQYTQAVADRLYLFPLDVGTGRCNGQCSESNQPVAFATWAIGSRRFPTSGGGTSAQSFVDPTESAIATAVEQAAGLTGMSSLLVSGGAVVPTTTTAARGAGPRGGVVIEDEGQGFRVTIATAGGVDPSAGLLVPEGGEIVCEICVRLAAGTTIEAHIYSEPRLAAAVRVPLDYDPDTFVCPLLRIPVGAPLDGGGTITPGVHTLQLRMHTEDGFQVLSTGITIGAPVPTSVPTGEGPKPATVLLLLAGALGLAYGIRTSLRTITIG